MRVGVAVSALLLLATAGPARAQIDARMLRHPAVSSTQIAFVYAGDIWLVPKAGGGAHRLSTPAGEESFPRFSPDGAQLGYTADYDGNPDSYVVPAAGARRCASRTIPPPTACSDGPPTAGTSCSRPA